MTGNRTRYLGLRELCALADPDFGLTPAGLRHRLRCWGLALPARGCAPTKAGRRYARGMQTVRAPSGVTYRYTRWHPAVLSALGVARAA